MNDGLQLMMAGLAGMLLGGVFFGGLWWTVGKCMTTSHPAQWMLASGLVRMSVALTGFYWISGGQWQRLVVCLVGFLIARLIVTLLTNHRETSGVVDEATIPACAELVSSSTIPKTESNIPQETEHAA